MADSQHKKIRARASPKTSSTGRKPRYSTPVLRAYGSVGALTMGMGGTVADFMGIAMMGASERVLKERIVRIGTHPRGFGLYLFDYKPQYRGAWGFGRRFGVLADEVEFVVPKAVSVHPDGYRVVDYAMLGIHLRPR